MKLCVLLFVFPLVSNAQIEEPLVGAYTITQGSEADQLIISSDKVEALINSNVVEKYFFYEKENDIYILEKVDLDVTSIDKSIKKDRRLFKVSLTHLSEESILLNITHPNGRNQEMIINKNE